LDFGPEGTFGPGRFRVEGDLTDLSADPEAFLAALRVRSGPDGASPQAPFTPDPGGDPFSGELWRAVERLVELPHFTADVRSALFEVAAQLPGAEVKSAVDPVGRPAKVVSVSYAGLAFEYYFDPGSRQLLARVGESLVDRGFKVYEIWLASGNVGSTDEVPASEDLLIPPPAGPLPAA
jgi:hypothetical protein